MWASEGGRQGPDRGRPHVHPTTAAASVSSTPGPMGPAGPQGAQGPAGAKGDTGATGPAGADGTAAEKGDTGPMGPAGPMGTPGAPGAIGPMGPAGPAGAAGTAGTTITRASVYTVSLICTNPVSGVITCEPSCTDATDVLLGGTCVVAGGTGQLEFTDTANPYQPSTIAKYHCAAKTLPGYVVAEVRAYARCLAVP